MMSLKTAYNKEIYSQDSFQNWHQWIFYFLSLCRDCWRRNVSNIFIKTASPQWLREKLRGLKKKMCWLSEKFHAWGLRNVKARRLKFTCRHQRVTMQDSLLRLQESRLSDWWHWPPWRPPLPPSSYSWCLQGVKGQMSAWKKDFCLPSAPRVSLQALRRPLPIPEPRSENNEPASANQS